MNPVAKLAVAAAAVVALGGSSLIGITCACVLPLGGAPAGSTTLDCFASPGACGYPDPAYGTVGVPSGTTLTNTAGRTITTNGTTINAENITGQMVISANNVMIQNSRITDSGGINDFAIFISSGVTGFKLLHSEVKGVDTSASGSIESAVHNESDEPAVITADYFHFCGDCVEYSATVTDTYMLNNGACTGCHYEDMYASDGTITVQHSTMFNVFGQTAVILMDTGLGAGGPCKDHLTLNNSLIGGGGFMLYPCASATSVGTSVVTITNNRFARCTTTPFGDAIGGTGKTCAGGGSNLAQIPDSHGYYPQGGYFGGWTAIYCGSTTWANNKWDDDNSLTTC